MDRLKTYSIETFGCKVNTYDTGLIQKQLDEAGYTYDTKSPELSIFNTCAVTEEATKSILKAIRKYRKTYLNRKILVTGCGVQVDPEKYKKELGIDVLVANSHKMNIVDIINDFYRGKADRLYRKNIFKKEDLEPGGGVEKNHSRAFLKIQDGCNSFCSFCIIPFARGKSRSLEISNLIERANKLYAEGYREVVLTGVHIGDYRDENGQNLDDLVESFLTFTKIPRIRLSSLEPIEISQRLLEMYSDERLCPHFHLSIQSASTKVLKDMKRKYTESDIRKCLYNIEKKVKNAFVGMDIIAGFPTETEEEFLNTFKVLSETSWTRLHVFPYSVRPGTRAMRFEQLERAIVKQRARKLRDLSFERFQFKTKEQIGTVKDILTFSKKVKGGDGLSHDYWPVRIEDSFKEKERYKVQIFDIINEFSKEGLLLGKVLRA